MIDKLLQTGGHRNIVSVSSHQWILDCQYYIFDMELCVLTLDEFINGGVRRVFGLPRFFDSEYSDRELSCFTLHTIMQNIASGLLFLHSKDEMHRDLKPRNGEILLSGVHVPSSSGPAR